MGKVKREVEDCEPSIPVTIGRAATAAGLSPKAVRLYEARGLLAAPTRTDAGYRLYTETDIAQLRFIATARRLGLHIDQVAEILTAAHDGQRPCATTNRLLDRRIDEITRAIDELTELRATLIDARAAAPTGTTDAAVCPVVESPRLRTTQVPRARA